MPILEARGLHKSYGSEAHAQVLRGADFYVDAGERVAIIGASGSGKSTLLHCLGGLDAPDQGQVQVQGEEIYAQSESQLALYRNRQIGFVFQFYHLLPEMTALENVMLPRLIGQQPAAEARRDAEALLEKIGLGEQAAQYPRTLSGGEQQRVALARAMMQKPPLLLADEPTGNLDHERGDQVLHLLHELCREQNTSLVMVTHDTTTCAQMDRICTLRDGKIYEQ